MGADPVFLTRAAEGLDRRGFTVEEVEAMISAGVIHADEKFELIEGEIVPVNPQAMPHLTMKARLARALLATCPAHIDIAQDATVMLGRRSFFDADILAFQADPTRRYVAPADALLAVEIADSSRARDPLHQGAPLRRGRPGRALGRRAQRAADLCLPLPRHGRLERAGAGRVRRADFTPIPPGRRHPPGPDDVKRPPDG